MALPKHQSFRLLGGCLVAAALIVGILLLSQWMGSKKFREHGTVAQARIISKERSIRYKTGNVIGFRVLVDTGPPRPSEIGDTPQFGFSSVTVTVSAALYDSKSVGDRIGVILLDGPDGEIRSLDSVENFRWRVTTGIAASLLLLGMVFFKLGGRCAPAP